MGVGWSAEGLAPRPPTGRGRENRKRRQISPAQGRRRNPNQPPAHTHPMRPLVRQLPSGERTMDAAPPGTPAGPRRVFRSSDATSGPNVQAGLTPSWMSYIYLFIFRPSSRRHATLKTRAVVHVLGSWGEEASSQMLRDRSGGRESFTLMLPLPCLVPRPLCFH